MALVGHSAGTSLGRHVLVAGGAIAGPAVALFLKRIGYSVALYEARSPTDRQGAGFAVAPNGMHVLDELGLGDAVRERASPMEYNCFRNPQGGIIAEYKPCKGELGPSWALLRQSLVDVLRTAVHAAGIPVHYDHAVESVTIDDSGPFTSSTEQQQPVVRVHFKNGASAVGGLLVGADGVHSVVRRSVLGDSTPPTQYIGIVGIGAVLSGLRFPDEHARRINLTYGPTGFFGYTQAGGDRWMWWTNYHRPEPFTRAELTAPCPPSLLPELQQQFAAYHAPIADLMRATPANELIRMNVYDVASLPRWHRGRIVLVGDAAHAVSPNSGQGASMALEDAALLSRLLRDHHYPHADAGASPEPALAAFERQRRSRVEKVVQEGRRRGGDKLAAGPLQWRLREALMRLVLRWLGPEGDRWMFAHRPRWSDPSAL